MRFKQMFTVFFGSRKEKHGVGEAVAVLMVPLQKNTEPTKNITDYIIYDYAQEQQLATKDRPTPLLGLLFFKDDGKTINFCRRKKTWKKTTTTTKVFI